MPACVPPNVTSPIFDTNQGSRAPSLAAVLALAHVGFVGPAKAHLSLKEDEDR
jgi:hypothetical protein